jgi:hypothetical protein
MICWYFIHHMKMHGPSNKIMVKITFTIPLLDTSLHIPIVPNKSSRFIQTSD